MASYDVIVIGSGPGGYVAAIRAAQLGMKAAVVERESLGGICLNWGCIPTKALLKSASVYEYIAHAKDYGIKVEGFSPDFGGMIKRSRDVADGMSKGIDFLFRKNTVETLWGDGKVLPGKKVEVTDKDGNPTVHEGKHILIATGARARELPNIPIDGNKVIEYRKAMILEKQPKHMVIMGGGAIGCEFAYFYNSIGTKVTLVEYLPSLLPREDPEVSKALERAYKKSGIKIKTGTAIESVDTSDKGVKMQLKTKKGTEELEADVLLSSVGVTPNTENIGLEEVGIQTEKGYIVADKHYKTNVEGYYSFGDCTNLGPALAHLASHEAINCVERIAGLHVEELDYNNIPSCTYCSPEVASVGYTEESAKEAGYEVKVGKFPFSASGKASASGHKEGFVKLIFDARYGEFLGAHMIGGGVTDMIAEVVAARKLETTGHEIIKSVHPHPTMSEAVMEAAAAAYNEVIHI
jgi:dihydrolipoamide dehydrogenase